MAENHPEFDVNVKLDDCFDASPIQEDIQETQQEDTNGIKTEADEILTDDLEGKDKSSNRKSGRYHPYKDRHGGSGDKKASQRNLGEVTYVELFKDAEGKSRLTMETVFRVVEFKDEEFVKKAIEVMNKYDLSGRPLNIKEDPDGEHARRVLQRGGGSGYPGGRGHDSGPAQVSLPPSISNNPNIPHDIISALQHGRLGATVFVANLDFKVGWKKLKEVFSMAGVVKRADDDKSLPPDDFRSGDKAPQLPRMDGAGFGGMNRMGGMGGGFGGMDGLGMGGFGGRDMTSMGRMGDMYRSGMGMMERDFVRSDMSRMFGDSFVGLGGMGNMGMDRMTGFDRMGGNMEMSRSFSQFGNSSSHMGGDRGAGSKGGCQIFVRNLSYDLTWQKLKEKFSQCELNRILGRCRCLRVKQLLVPVGVFQKLMNQIQ
ncbi:Myelin expression factor 2 [Bagarius yarrelli]|uniref:Myelin expression factor 2 n=1 Tax=Bagarius yarrelli TaxID=175774 RepID=A0A556VX87_BAGYA|nr:Myelin expression factor 2 [Bagarius yarrelli]